MSAATTTCKHGFVGEEPDRPGYASIRIWCGDCEVARRAAIETFEGVIIKKREDLACLVDPATDREIDWFSRLAGRPVRVRIEPLDLPPVPSRRI